MVSTPRMLDRAAHPLAGDILECAGLEDGVQLRGDNAQRSGIVRSLVQPVADRLGGFHDLIRRCFRGPHDGFQFQATVAGGGGGHRDHGGHLILDPRELAGQIGLAVIHQLHGGVDLGAQFGDAAVGEPAQFIEQGHDLRLDAVADMLAKAV